MPDTSLTFIRVDGPKKGQPRFVKLGRRMGLKLGPQPIAAQNTPSVSGWQE
ncbi:MULTISPECIES: hypothetical protein [Eubacteriales]|uniref:hypothetical protein n=1 Tax=Eubacteriales TaxID=186802 RepID=UPI001F06F597|nr:hypothetical protein [Lawsonibacter sp. OA9]